MTNRDYILNEIKNHKSELSKFGIQHIGLFGSYARNEPSDQIGEVIKKEKKTTRKN